MDTLKVPNLLNVSDRSIIKIDVSDDEESTYSRNKQERSSLSISPNISTIPFPNDSDK